MESRRVALEAEIAKASRPKAPRLHPNLAGVYRERVERLREALAADRSPEVVEAVRSLIERVEVRPAAAGGRMPRIELVGHLAAMLQTAGVGPATKTRSPLAVANGLDVFLSSELGDAGTRNRRCQYITVDI